MVRSQKRYFFVFCAILFVVVSALSLSGWSAFQQVHREESSRLARSTSSEVEPPAE